MKVTIELDTPNNITKDNIEYWLRIAFSYAAYLNYRQLYNVKGVLSMVTRKEIKDSWSYTYTIE